MAKKTYKIAVLNSHPIQYFAPLYKQIAQTDEIDLTVFYCSRRGIDSYIDEGFGQRIQWDIPLLEGYEHEFLTNWNRWTKYQGFLSLINPGIIPKLVGGNGMLCGSIDIAICLLCCVSSLPWFCEFPYSPCASALRYTYGQITTSIND